MRFNNECLEVSKKRWEGIGDRNNEGNTLVDQALGDIDAVEGQTGDERKKPVWEVRR